jgi:hypothetical protein
VSEWSDVAHAAERHGGGEMLEHFTNIWNAITHKSFWDCKLKISCVERDSKYFERDLNILISLRRCCCDISSHFLFFPLPYCHDTQHQRQFSFFNSDFVVVVVVAKTPNFCLPPSHFLPVAASRM